MTLPAKNYPRLLSVILPVRKPGLFIFRFAVRIPDNLQSVSKLFRFAFVSASQSDFRMDDQSPQHSPHDLNHVARILCELQNFTAGRAAKIIYLSMHHWLLANF
jgi:hypothetical protein